ncbi:unnamed protein product [Closterium sp. NIES-53]
MSGHGFESRCLHMYAVAAARSPGGLSAHSDPLLNKPFYPNGLVVGILTCFSQLVAPYCTSASLSAALLPSASRPAGASASRPTAANAPRSAALQVTPCCSQRVVPYCSQRVSLCCPSRRALLSNRPAATRAAAAARATAAAGGGAAGSVGSATGAGGARGANESVGGATGAGGVTGSAGGAAGAGAARGGQRRSLPLPDDPTPQQLREWVLQRARPCGGGFGFLRTAQRRHQSQQETFSPQVLSELFPQQCVTGSVKAVAEGASESAVALGASESAAALGASESAAALGARASPATCPSSAEALHNFTLDSGASRCFFCDCTTLTPLAAPVPVSLADPTGGPVTLLWHHHLGHPSLPRLRGMHSRLLVSGLPRSLPSLPRFLAPLCLPCVEGRQRAAHHSSECPPTTAPLQTLHMDVWGPAPVGGTDQELYFLLVVDDYIRYTTVFPLQRKVEVSSVLIPWIRATRRRLRERFSRDFPVLRLNFDRGKTSPTLRWTGKVCDASVFRVRGALSLVRDAKASKLSSRTLRCVFPTTAPPWQFYHTCSRRVFSSQDVNFDEFVCYYRPHPHASHPIPLAPLFLVDPPPLVEPLEISSDSSGPAEEGDPAADDTAATHRSPCLETPPGFPPWPSSPPPQSVVVNSRAETAGVELGGAETEGEGSGGAATRGAGSGGAATEGASSWGAATGATEA